MTRQLSVTKEFDHGTLLDVTLYPERNDEPSHAYYVPAKAQERAGMQEIYQTDSYDDVRDGKHSYDWDAIQNFVPATKIVEWAEEEILHRVDGDIGQSDSPMWTFERSRQKTGLPPGVVKFGPTDDDDEYPDRDPLERGYCWAAVQKRVHPRKSKSLLRYQGDVEDAYTPRARVPLDVINAGQAATVAYLAAHDHHDGVLARALDLDLETVRELVEDVTQEARES